jgi:hypothetical protein
LATIFLVSRRIRCFFQKLPASCCRYCTRGLDGWLSCGEDLDAFGIVGAQRNFVPLSALHHGDARPRRPASPAKQVTLSHCGRRPLTANHRAALLQRTEDRGQKGDGPFWSLHKLLQGPHCRLVHREVKGCPNGANHASASAHHRVEENAQRHSGSWDPFPSKQGNSGGDHLWKDGALAGPFVILALLMYPSYLCANLTRAAPPKRKRARGLTRELPRMAVPVLYCTCPSVPLPGDPLLRYALVPAFRPGGGVAGPLSPLGRYRSSATSYPRLCDPIRITMAGVDPSMLPGK